MTARIPYALIVLGLGTSVAGAAPSTRLDDYVLFAGSSLQAKALHVARGGIGVNAGPLQVHEPLDAPQSIVAATTVQLGGGGRCAALFSTTPGAGGGTQCGPAQGFVPPLVADLAGACGLEVEHAGCNPGSPVVVGRDETRMLEPGSYGDVSVRAGAGHAGRLLLTGGDYVFCSLQLGRHTTLEAAAPVDVLIDGGDLHLTTGSTLGPGSGVDPADVVVRTTGARATLGRHVHVGARLCAPSGFLQLEDDVLLEGSFVASTIRARRISASGLEESSTTTTLPGTTSTSTTTASVTSSTTTSSTTSSTRPPTTTSSTTTTSVSTSTTTSAPPTTTSTTSTTTVTATTSTSTTSTPATTSTTTTSSPATTSTTSTTTSTSVPTTTSSTTSTTKTTTTSTSSTTTTNPAVTCPASGLIDATATLVPALNGSTETPAGGIKVHLSYPASVVLPGSGNLPVNDPTDPTTREALIDFNLYNGFVIFFDSDTALDTSVAGVPIPLGTTYPFVRGRFDCAVGTQVAPSGFACAVVDESDPLGGMINTDRRPACTVSVTTVP